MIETAPLPAEAVAEQTAVETQPTAFYRAKPTERRLVKLTPEQQARWDSEWKKREAKIHQRYRNMRRDLMDTAGLLQQVTERFMDRLSPGDSAAIFEGVAAIRKEYADGRNTNR